MLLEEEEYNLLFSCRSFLLARERACRDDFLVIINYIIQRKNRKGKNNKFKKKKTVKFFFLKKNWGILYYLANQLSLSMCES